MKYSLRNIVITAFLILLGLNSRAQTDSAVSFYKALISSETNDSLKLTYYTSLANAFYPQMPDSGLYYAQLSLKKGMENHHLYAEINGYSMIGMYHISQNQIAEAKPFYEKAEKRSEDVDWLSYQAVFLRILGNIDLFMDDYAGALSHWTKGIEVAKKQEHVDVLIEMYSNIGKLYLQIEDYAQAETNFQTSYEICLENKLNELYPNAVLNLSDIAFQRKNYREAKKHARNIIRSRDSIDKSRNFFPAAYEKLGQASLALNEPDSALVYFAKMKESLVLVDPLYNGPGVIDASKADLGLGKSWYALGNLQNAKTDLYKAYTTALENQMSDILKESAELLAKIAEHDGDYQSALTFYRNYKAASDTIFNEDRLRDLTRKEMEFAFAEQTRLQEEALSKMKAKQARQRIALYVQGAFAILVITIAILLYRLQVNKRQKSELKQKSLQADLDYRNRELASNVLYLLKKNELLIKISDQLKKSLQKNKTDQKSVVESVLKEIDFSSKEIGWDEFEMRFKEVHSEFYERLVQQFPSLTKNEQRLCAFLKLKMTTKEISAITFQSAHSINVARSRMKKKMGIEDNQRLVQFLSQL